MKKHNTKERGNRNGRKVETRVLYAEGSGVDPWASNWNANVGPSMEKQLDEVSSRDYPYRVPKGGKGSGNKAKSVAEVNRRG